MAEVALAEESRIVLFYILKITKSILGVMNFQQKIDNLLILSFIINSMSLTNASVPERI